MISPTGGDPEHFQEPPEIFENAINWVREGIEAWYDTGINTLIVVPTSARGNQMVAFEELRAAFR